MAVTLTREKTIEGELSGSQRAADESDDSFRYDDVRESGEFDNVCGGGGV